MRSRVAVIATAISLFIFFSYLLLPSHSPSSQADAPVSPAKQRQSPAKSDLPDFRVAQELLNGDAIMPHLGNETIKQELGRASWKLLHTMLARFPTKPTSDEREALSTYLHLFARLYPCGECAAHFKKLLKKFPPQTSSRDAASQWGCFVHNQVNERLGKEAFDCGKVTEAYKCGCADAEGEGDDMEGDGKKNEGKKPAAASQAGKGEERKELKEKSVDGKGKKDEKKTTMDTLERNAMSAKKGARVEIEKAGMMNGG